MIKKLFCIAICVLMALSCKKDNDPENMSGSFSVTLGVLDVNDWSATLEGRASVLAHLWSKERCGFLLSAGKVPTWQQHDLKFESNERNFPCKYSVVATGLQPETQYYYRAYTCHEDGFYLGEVKEFTTKAIVATVTAGDPIFNNLERSVLVRAQLSYDKIYEPRIPISYWFHFATEENIGNIKHESTKRLCSDYSGGSFEITITGLESYKHYFILPAAEVNGRIFYGPTKSFYSPDYSRY